VEEGVRYMIEDIEVNEYDGKRELHFTNDTTVDPLGD